MPFQFSDISYPSDTLTIRDFRTRIPQEYRLGVRTWLDRDKFKDLFETLEMIIGLEHEVASRAIAHSSKVQLDQSALRVLTDGAVARDLMDYYQTFGIVQGPAEARELIRKIRSDAIAADKQIRHSL